MILKPETPILALIEKHFPHVQLTIQAIYRQQRRRIDGLRLTKDRPLALILLVHAEERVDEEEAKRAP